MTHTSSSFPEIPWSQVQAAASREGAALESLCAACWRPIYGWIRWKGYPPEDAKDLTQEFFARLIEKNYLGDACADYGTFSAFLIGCLRHFLANEWDRAHAQKRGGACVTVAIDDVEAHCEPCHHLTPEVIYERHWAESLMERVQTQLRLEYRDRNQSARFELMEPFLSWDQPRRSYATLAAALGSSETAAKVGVHRLRRRYGDLLRTELEVVADGSYRSWASSR
jgi:DNA-directed RNA polymerase specialized sigma24 family protein